MKQSILLILVFFVTSLSACAKTDKSEQVEQDTRAIMNEERINEEAEKLSELLQSVNKKMEALNEEFKNAPAELQNNEEYRNSLVQQFEALDKESDAIYFKYIKENPNSYISLVVISQMAQQNKNTDLLPDYFALLNPELQNLPDAQKLKTHLERLKLTAIGSVAPEFTQNDANGKAIKLSDFRGKYLLVDFWASWCGPCRKENPAIVKAYNQFKNKNFEILGVSLDNPNGKQAWLNAVQKDGLTWTQVSDLNGWKNEAAMLYGVQSIPQNFLLDPNGVIIAKNLRGTDLIAKLGELIKD